MVEPIESPASAVSPMWPTMAVSMSTNAGSAMSWPKVGMARGRIWRLMARASAGVVRGTRRFYLPD